VNTAEIFATAALRCPGCGTEVGGSLLACPACHRLVHADRLKVLAAEAASAAERQDVIAELTAWRASLDLLPEGSRQYTTIASRVSELSRTTDARLRQGSGADAQAPSGRWKWLAALGPIGLLLWKFKFLIVAVASKGKLLVLGLTKASTFTSMLLAFGVYWTQWGMWFAFGFVLSIYVHEMGHVAALRRYGIAASAPMFIPGVGALVRLKQRPVDPREDARIGLAGPIWGLGATLVAYAGALAGGGALWMAVAHVSAWINLFNLLPIWQLDGGRGFAALSTEQRWMATASLGAGWFICGDGLLVLLMLVAFLRAAAGQAPPSPDRPALVQYVGLVLALSLLVRVAVAPTF
jgi:Zn-dependent protease